MTFKRILTGTVACLSLMACDGGLPFGGSGGEGAPVGIQIAHPAAIVLDVISVSSSGDRTLVNIRVLNGRDREIKLSPRNEDTYILLDSGEKLPLIPSATNPGLAVPPSKAMDGAIVFSGSLPRSGKALLMLNERGSSDGEYTNIPRFEASLSLDGLSGGTMPEASALSNMNNLPVSNIRPARSGGTSLTTSGNTSSSLQAVEKLKSDLGAVKTDRGTLVSLPGDVTFDFDKATIRAQAGTSLDKLVNLIRAGGSGEISVEGHTDAKGDDAYNKRLSEQRASAVKTYLTDKGIEASRIKTIGLGELRPVAPNAKPDGSDDEDSRQRNRRVEVILPKAAAKAPKAAQ